MGSGEGIRGGRRGRERGRGKPKGWVSRGGGNGGGGGFRKGGLYQFCTCREWKEDLEVGFGYATAYPIAFCN
ncbi:hypothetical protein Bca52824_001729 [Brassica carinata]|uniref:Uncharacterized protein n=1 Tax=Brassica carinata TaxID=52824 RepID=A0A8X8B9Z7_BRACI|nr:hypothetical protein Bca52824_001729 [Brassica carinata]